MITSLTNGPGGGGGCSSSCVPNGTEGIQSQRTHSYFKKKMLAHRIVQKSVFLLPPASFHFRKSKALARRLKIRY